MHAEAQYLLRMARTGQELRRILHALCDPWGTVEKTDVLCDKDAPQQMTCMVQMANGSSAHRVASRFGTMTFGNKLVVFKYEADPDFVMS